MATRAETKKARERAKLLKAAKNIQLGKAVVTKAANVTNKPLSNITKADVTKFIKKAPKATLLRTAAGAGAGGIAGIVGPAALLLTVIGTQMKKDSALSKFLNKSKEKDLPKAMSPGPKKKKKLSGISGKQKKENEKRANIREGQRGKVGPKRMVIKTSTGILRDKSGKAVKRLSREEVLKRRKANR